MKFYFSLTPIESFNSPSSFVDCGEWSFKRFSLQELVDIFEIEQKDFGHYKDWVGIEFPSNAELSEIKNHYFLCFNDEQNHEKHFNYVVRTLYFFSSFPAITGKTFYCRPDYEGFYDYRTFNPAKIEMKDIPASHVPEIHRAEHIQIIEQNLSDMEALNLHYLGIIDWHIEEYGRLRLTENIVNDFNKLEGQFLKLYEENRSETRFLRFAINLYISAVEKKDIDDKIIWPCIIWELLLLDKNSGRRKGLTIANRAALLLSGEFNQEELVKIKGLIEKYYSARNDIMHGFAYDEKSIKIKMPDILEAYEITRKLILIFLKKIIENKNGKKEILDRK